MNRRNILSLSVMTACGLTLLPASAVGQQRSQLMDQLVGTWNIASWERTAPDGSKVHTYGTNPKGINFFGTNGRFFVFFAHGDLPILASNDRSKVTPQEAKTHYLGSIAYHGTYTVDDASRTIDLRMETSTFPNQLGRQHKRMIVSLTANELKYRNLSAMAGGEIEVALKRAPAPITN